MFLFGNFGELSLGGSFSSSPERTALRKWGEESGHIEVYNKGQVVWASKVSGKLQKTRYLKLRNVALFYVWEHTRVWAYWNHSFHMHLSHLGPASCIFHILNSSMLTAQWARELSYSAWVPLGVRNSHLEGWNHWWLWSLFAGMAGNTPFLTACKTKQIHKMQNFY